jgi:hypothetical protein
VVNPTAHAHTGQVNLTPRKDLADQESGNAPRPKLSLILCTRNDSYQGNSVWRLQTALNYTAEAAALVGRLDDVEIVVGDWGSETPVRDALSLTSEAARITRFVTIPPEIARAEQKDSPFPEVLALNAAARRARGEYIGRIDQDILVSAHFLEKFFWLAEKQRLLVPFDKAVLISNRRNIPYRVAVSLPSLAVVARYIRWFGRYLPRMDPPPAHLFYQCWIGILLMHRDIWHECGGYDESFIYMDFMEMDVILRLSSRYQVVDLGQLVDCAFYHLNHERPRVTRHVNRYRRKVNPWRTLDDMPEEFAPNSAEWGLARHDLEVLPGRAAEPAGSSFVPTWLACATLSLVAAAETVVDFFIDRYVALRARLSAAGRSTPDGRLSGSASSGS